jgi:nucleoid-associated protein YgaU
VRLGTTLVLAVVLLTAPAAADRVHVVQPGESLWQIAKVLTGDPTLWPLLYRANRDQIVDPSRLYPGQKLSIPDLEPDAPAPVGTGPGPSGPR